MTMQIVPEVVERCKYWLGVIGRSDVFIGILIILVGCASFGLGYRAAGEQHNVTITSSAERAAALQQPAASALAPYVGSRRSDKYHYPWCSGAKRISPENRIQFRSAQAAADAGYEPAQNCAGLQ
jgi:hypothetical protein